MMQRKMQVETREDKELVGDIQIEGDRDSDGQREKQRDSGRYSEVDRKTEEDICRGIEKQSVIEKYMRRGIWRAVDL